LDEKTALESALLMPTFVIVLLTAALVD
jgi:hypothetical protein